VCHTCAEALGALVWLAPAERQYLAARVSQPGRRPAEEFGPALLAELAKGAAERRRLKLPHRTCPPAPGFLAVRGCSRLPGGDLASRSSGGSRVWDPSVMQWHWGNTGSMLAGLSAIIAVAALIRSPGVLRDWRARQDAEADAVALVTGREEMDRGG
jgi:hypothetical protein